MNNKVEITAEDFGLPEFEITHIFPSQLNDIMEDLLKLHGSAIIPPNVTVNITIDGNVIVYFTPPQPVNYINVTFSVT